jgi:hypothetical protein
VIGAVLITIPLLAVGIGCHVAAVLLCRKHKHEDQETER